MEEKVRISKLMAERGLCSRREADAYIERGWVRVDGRVVDELGSKAWPHQTITLDRQAQRRQTSRVTILLHKPVGYVSGQAEGGYRTAVSLILQRRASGAFFPIDVLIRRICVAWRRPAGCDIDSTGLLVLRKTAVLRASSLVKTRPSKKNTWCG